MKRHGNCCYLGFGMILFQKRWLTARIFPSVSLNQFPQAASIESTLSG